MLKITRVKTHHAQQSGGEFLRLLLVPACGHLEINVDPISHEFNN